MTRCISSADGHPRQTARCVAAYLSGAKRTTHCTAGTLDLACLSGSSRTAVLAQHWRSLLTPSGHARQRSLAVTASTDSSSSHSPGSLLPVHHGGITTKAATDAHINALEMAHLLGCWAQVAGLMLSIRMQPVKMLF